MTGEYGQVRNSCRSPAEQETYMPERGLHQSLLSSPYIRTQHVTQQPTKMSPSTGVEPVVALGSERQTSIRCDEGIDLFVSLQIDPTEVAEADFLPWQAGPCAPRPLRDLPTLVTPPAVGDVEESPFRARVLRNWKPSCEKVAPEELFEEVILPTPPKDPPDLAQAPNQRSSEPPRSRQVEESQSVPDVRGAGLINVPSAAVLSVAQRYEHQSLNSEISIKDQQVQEHNDPEQNEQESELASDNGFQSPCVSEAQCEQASDDGVLNPCVSEGQCSVCEYGIPARGTPHEINCRRHEDLEEHDKDRSTWMDEEPYLCKENRKWSPVLQDYCGMSIDLNRSPDNQVSGCTWLSRCTGGRADLGEDVGQVCVNVPSASLPSEKVIESFDIAEISAACQLVKMRTCVHKGELTEQDQAGLDAYDVFAALDAYDVFGSECGAHFREGTVSEVRKATDHMTSSPVHVRNPGNASRPGANSMELSVWYDDNKYIPRLARRAKRQLRRAKFIPRIDFGNSHSNADPDYSDSEVLRKSPKKRQYKSTRELMQA